MKKHRFGALVAALSAVLAIGLAAFAPPAGAETEFAAPAGTETQVVPYACEIGAYNVGVTLRRESTSNGEHVSPTVCLYETPTSGTEITPGVAASVYTDGAVGVGAGAGVVVCHVGYPVEECAKSGGTALVASTTPVGAGSMAGANFHAPEACVGNRCFFVSGGAWAWGPAHSKFGVSAHLFVCEQYWLGLECPVAESHDVPVPRAVVNFIREALIPIWG